MEDETRWLTPAELEDWKALLGLAIRLPSVLDAQLKRDGSLSVFEYHVLVALESAGPEASVAMGQLARLAWGSPSRLSHAVSRLEQAGWVTRQGGEGRGRRAVATLTAAGRHQLEVEAPGHVTEVRRLLDALEPGQLEALGSAARRMLSAADEGPS